MAADEAPDFEARLAVFGSARFKKLRPGQRFVLASYAAELGHQQHGTDHCVPIHW